MDADDLEELRTRARQDDANVFCQWLGRTHADLDERLRRLVVVEPSYRMDMLHEAIPADEIRKLAAAIRQSRLDIARTTIWRALPSGSSIRPGDWVSLSAGYAKQHVRGNSSEVDRLDVVDSQHIHWSGTDINEFFYLPKGFVRPDMPLAQYCAGLDDARWHMLLHGEMARLKHHAQDVQRIISVVTDDFDEERLGTYHGPDHWRRVAAHATAACRSLGLDPLAGVIFGWVHDSRRHDEGVDPLHGRRAGEFVRSNSGPGELFGFLRSSEIELLSQACDLHSDGLTEGNPLMQACWDADRLDLWRCGIEPDPDCLCTPWARQTHIIQAARLNADEHESYRADRMRC